MTTLNLVKRAAKGSELNMEEFDRNYTEIEKAVKGLNDRLDAVEASPVSDIRVSEVEAQASHTESNVSAILESLITLGDRIKAVVADVSTLEGRTESLEAESVYDVYSWASWGGTLWSGPPAFVAKEDLRMKFTWTAQGYRNTEGMMGWSPTVLNATLVGHAPYLRRYASRILTHFAVGPVSAFYDVKKGQSITPTYGSGVAGTMSNASDYFSITAEPV